MRAGTLAWLTYGHGDKAGKMSTFYMTSWYVTTLLTYITRWPTQTIFYLRQQTGPFLQTTGDHHALVGWQNSIPRHDVGLGIHMESRVVLVLLIFGAELVPGLIRAYLVSAQLAQTWFKRRSASAGSRPLPIAATACSS